MSICKNSNVTNSSFLTKRWMFSTALTAVSLVAMAATSQADTSTHSWANLNQDVGSFSTDKALNNVTNIKLNTERAISSGDADIYAGHTVNVDGSLFVVRDTKSDPTNILGHLNSNGKIVIIDTNGVFFGKNSRVDVAGILAISGDIDNKELMDNSFGDYKIKNIDGRGAIELNGVINVAEAGLAAFVSPFVTNNGVINAKLGKVLMASGDTVTLDLYGDGLFEVAVEGELADALIKNTGTLNVQGGTVQITAMAAKDAVDNIINMEGVVNVASVTQEGGKIVLSGGAKGNVNISGEMDASGTNGGTIDVKAENITVASEAVLKADGGKGSDKTGNGGIIDVIAQNNADFRGALSSKGGELGGDGGNAEVSGYEYLGFQGLANLSAPNGEMGTLLMDPRFTIIHSGLIPGILQKYVISAQALANSMETANIVVQAEEFIDVGTRNDSYDTGSSVVDWALNALVGTADIDFSTYSKWFGFHTGTTSGSITLQSDIVNFNKDVIMGNGNLGVNAHVVNLDSRLYDADGVTALGDARLFSNAGEVNVRSNDALIQQGVWLADDNGGATLNIAAGIYEEQVGVNKNLSLIGAGQSETVIVSPDALDTSFGVYKAVLSAHDADNVNISNLKVDGAGKGDDNYRFAGIAYNNAGGSVSNTTVAGVTSTPVSASDHGFGIHANILDGNSYNLDVTGNTVYGFQKNGITFHGAGLTGTIFGNKVTGVGETNVVSQNAIQVGYGAIADITGNNVSDIAFTGDKWSGISILLYGAGEGTVVSGNTVVGTGYDLGVAVAGSNGAVVSGNNITGSKMGVYAGDSDNVTIKNNIITSSTDESITIKNSAYARVAGNKISGGGDGIIIRDSDYAMINLNKIDNVSGNGIDVSGGIDALIRSNKVRNAAHDGISVWYNDNAKIKGNIVKKAGYDGIDVRNSDYARVIINKIYKSGHEGIDINGGNDALIRNNKIYSAGWDGIDVRNNNSVIIEGNVVKNVGADGIDVDQSGNVEILWNYIAKSGDNGIEVTDSGDSIIVFNKVVKSENHGIFVEEGNKGVFVYANFTENNLGSGIYVDGAPHVEIIGNTIRKNGEDGIYVSDVYREKTLIIEDNEIFSNASNGIEIENSRNTYILNNDIYKNGDNGLAMMGDENGYVVLAGNDFTDNSVGAYFESGEVDFSDITNPNSFANTDSAATPVGMRFNQIGDKDSLSLVGNSFGTTEFSGFQNAGSYYIRLDGGSFLNSTGLPIVLNAFNATFDGITPINTLGILTPDIFNFIENRLYDADDSPLGVRGQVFVGIAPTLDNFEDFFKLIGGFDKRNTGINVTITGLPSIGLTIDNAASELNLISPAAGGEGEQEQNANELANVEPAAGENSKKVSCWGDAISAASRGAQVTYSFEESSEAFLADASACSAANL